MGCPTGVERSPFWRSIGDSVGRGADVDMCFGQLRVPRAWSVEMDLFRLFGRCLCPLSVVRRDVCLYAWCPLRLSCGGGGGVGWSGRV